MWQSHKHVLFSVYKPVHVPGTNEQNAVGLHNCDIVSIINVNDTADSSSLQQQPLVTFDVAYTTITGCAVAPALC